MKLRIIFSIFFISTITLSSFAQDNLDAYKYIIVPEQFSFQKSEDQYQLNSLTKFLFEKEGFQVIFENASRPEDLAKNPCLGITSKVKESSGMFSTKLIIELLNCRNEVVFKSTEGKSKIKEFKKGNQEALRKAFESVKTLNYSYNPVKVAVKEEIVEEVIEEDTTTNEELGYDDIEVTETKTESEITQPKEGIKLIEESKPVLNNTAIDILYAQSKNFGFQLVDSTPKVVYKLQKSSVKNIFILKDKNGIVFKKDDIWVAEYYENNVLIRKELNIKF